MGCVTQKQSKHPISKTQTIETLNHDDGQDNQDVDHPTFQTSTLEHKRKEITKQIMQETGLKGQEYVEYIKRKVCKNSQKSAQSAINTSNKQQSVQNHQMNLPKSLSEMVYLMKADEIIEDRPVLKEYRPKITVLKYGNSYQRK